MNEEKITKIVSMVRAKKESNKKSTENTVDPNKEKVAKIANIMLEIEKCVTKLED
jgi:hypothetical protein